MSDRIHIVELKKAIARVGNTFATKDVSEQPELRAAHPFEAGQKNWHALVGSAISKNRGVLEVTSVGRSPGGRGEQWSKSTGDAEKPAPVAAPTAAITGIGPQSASDAPFTAQVRRHQSWWRAEVLKVPCGTGPQPSDHRRLGSMLEPADAEAGKNFLTEEIHEVVRRRMAENRGTLERYRLLHNLLSSQPMCFNLFGPLVDRPERATRLLRALLGEDVARVKRVMIEWAPEPASAYLDDRTAFDAAIEYERANGDLVLVGIETKLTDTFSQKPYGGESYLQWMRGASSPFRLESWDALALPQHNQIWRNHLLAIAMRDRSGSPYAAAHSMVVHHPLDVGGARDTASYRRHLTPGDDMFSVRTLDHVIDAFASAATAGEEPWLAAFRRRYIHLNESALS